VDRTAERGVPLESKKGARAIVIVGVSAEDPAKMRLAQDHDVIQAFSADRARPKYLFVGRIFLA
jgi:hypothetical protein